MARRKKGRGSRRSQDERNHGVRLDMWVFVALETEGFGGREGRGRYGFCRAGRASGVSLLQQGAQPFAIDEAQ